MTIVVALNGANGAGKDTVADFMVADHGFVKLSFADVLREMLSKLNPVLESDMDWNTALYRFGYDEAKRRFPEMRRIMVALAEEVIKPYCGENIFANGLLRKLFDVRRRGINKFVISDLRFVIEYEALRALKPYCAFVERPSLVSPVHSEIVHAFPFHYIVLNDRDLGVLRDRTSQLVVAATAHANG